MKHIFIIGAKSLGEYGGYETFVDKLTEYNEVKDGIQYYIACKANGLGAMDISDNAAVHNIKGNNFIYHNAKCHLFVIPEKLGPAQAILYDLAALKYYLDYIEKNSIENAVIYILACRIGPFIKKYYSRAKALGVKIFLNPDGHEWKRSKWPAPVRRYWKKSEELMVRNSDLVICDSVNIEKYIQENYDKHDGKLKTTFIAYGSETRNSVLSDEDVSFVSWLEEKNLKKNEYYLIVGRFVPENNYETMIREFMHSSTKKNLAIITNANEKLKKALEDKLHFSEDPRIRFVGTVYNQELLMKIRENAFAYFHGHEVGGTNPSLLEALGSTRVNLLLDVGFNKEVGLDSALYWNKERGNLSALIETVENMSEDEKAELGKKAKSRIEEAYSWKYITDRYREVFLNS